ncbi:hypothetical protein [Priestia endophytica]|jgi:hypothetical protein|uniref:hypothetical protein n=1 Tax=Priestia endophytica TaxID=135735 RepID=UPI001F5C0136|nr:hypothetical protein [Priestia endophytica]
MRNSDKNQFSRKISGKISSPGHVFNNDNRLNKNSIDNTGNSDVDVTVDVEIDTMPIAFAMLYSLFASKQISSEEFELAIQRLKSWNDKDNSNADFYSGRDINNIVDARLFHSQDSIEDR